MTSSSVPPDHYFARKSTLKCLPVGGAYAIKAYSFTDHETNFDAIAGIAESYFLSRQFDKARDYYQKLLTMTPPERDFNYYLQMGRAEMILLNFDRAIFYFEKALAIDKENESVKIYLERCHKEKRQLGQYK